MSKTPQQEIIAAWSAECAYVATMAARAKRGATPEAFHCDPQCLRRYIDMQAKSASAQGLPDVAGALQYHSDSLAGLT